MSDLYENNPLGDHRQNMESDPEEVSVELARKGKMVTSTALNAFGLARKWADAGMKLPVFRDYNLELFVKGSDNKVKYPNAQSVWDYMRRVCDENGGERRVLFNVTCEMDMTDALYNAYIELMDLSAKSGSPIGMVFSNAAYLPSWWDDDKGGNHYKRPMALAYLNKLHEMSGVKLANGLQAFWHGDHQYTSGYWCAFSNAGQFMGDPQSAFSDKWKTGEYAIDFSKPQWHLGGKLQGIMDALGWRWDHPTRQWVAQDGKNPQFQLPGTILSETLFGSMSIAALLAAFPNWKPTPPWNRDIRGYRAHEAQWAEWYPELSAEGGVGRVLTEMQVQAWLYIWLLFKNIAGTHHFARGNTGGWDADNVYKDKGYSESVVNVRLPIPMIDGTTPTPPPTPTPNPTVDDPRFAPYRIETVASGGANVRQRPSTSAAIVGSIGAGGVEIAHIPYDSLTAAEKALARPVNDLEWYLVRVVRSGKEYVGWTRSDVVSKPVPVVVEPPPEPPVNEDLASWLAAEEGALAETESLLNHLTPALAIAQSQRLTHIETIAYIKAKMEEVP